MEFNLNLNEGSADMSYSMRQARTDLATPVEQKIREVMSLVEDMGADLRLTDAVDHLGKALESVGEYQDEKLQQILLDRKKFIQILHDMSSDERVDLFRIARRVPELDKNIDDSKEQRKTT
jgi:hypothetical protein